MIAELRGTVVYKSDAECVVDVHGIGFAVWVSSRTMAGLGRVGERVHLYTHLLIREDEWRLVGFASVRERRRFLDLMAVNGVGVKVALAILGQWDADELEGLVHKGQWQTLKQAPGVGAKLAQRLQLELASRWKVNAPMPQVAPAGEGEAQDVVVEGLMALGYSADEAWAAVNTVEQALPDEVRLREALKRLDRRQGGGNRG